MRAEVSHSPTQHTRHPSTFSLPSYRTSLGVNNLCSIWIKKLSFSVWRKRKNQSTYSKDTSPLNNLNYFLFCKIFSQKYLHLYLFNFNIIPFYLTKLFFFPMFFHFCTTRENKCFCLRYHISCLRSVNFSTSAARYIAH